MDSIVNFVELFDRKYAGSRKKEKEFYLLCDFADKNMSEEQIIKEAINGYRKRWKIEEVHRQMKQDLNWESMRLASYTMLKKP